MKNPRWTGAVALIMMMILMLTVLPGAAAQSAPVPTGSDLTEEDEQLLQNTFGGDADEDETAEEAGDDAVVENPDEEEAFLEDLMAELDVDEANALGQINGMTHILLIGMDARPGHKSGRSDTMLLLTIDAKNKCMKLTSFMRDLYVEIPGHKNNRLNSAFMFGGPELLIKTLKKNFGVKVNYYAAVNFSVLADLIDQIGGLTLNIESEKQMKYINLVIKEDNVVLKRPIQTGASRRRTIC